MNNKGFLLIETLIATGIIAVLATSLYIYVNSTITNYEKRENYDNIIDVYKTNNIKQYLYNNWDSSWENGINDITGSIGTLNTELKIKTLLIVPNNLSTINKTDIIEKTTNNAFKEYIRLLSFVGETTDYRLIIHYNDGKNNSFSSLVMKLPSSS